MMDDQHNRTQNDILNLLAPYFGAAAPWVLSQAERRASGAAEVVLLLAQALSNQTQREQFLTRFLALDESDSTLAGNVHPRPESEQAAALPELTLTVAEQRLMDLIGEAGRDAARKMDPRPTNVVDLYAHLALHIEDLEERKKFIALCPGRIPDV